MAVRTNVSSNGSGSFTSALGGTINANDSIVVNYSNDDYTSDLTIGVSVVDVVFTSTYGGSVAGSPLKIDSTGKIVVEFGGRELRLTKNSGAHNQVFMRCAGRVVHSDVVVTEAYKYGGGDYIVEDTCDVNSLVATAGLTHLRKTSSNTTNTAKFYGAARAKIERPVTTLEANAGSRVECSNESVACGTVTVGGELVYGGGNVSTKLTVLPGGVVDFSKLRQAITITAAELHEGAKVIGPPQGIAITWTAGYGYVGRGPEVVGAI
ncbi:MAG: hypothetical protein EBZ59_12255 [Planctomycetia bacterium]|nr:hypothetical protein [Planctomycetia bacterium]